MEFDHYAWQTGMWPEVDWDAEPDLEDLDVYLEDIFADAGFDPDDPTISYGRLTTDWYEHPAGAIVFGQSNEADHTPFAVSRVAVNWV